MENELYAYWANTSQCFGKVVHIEKDKNGNPLYFIHWDDEETARADPYSKEDTDCGDLIIGKNVKVLYGRKKV